MPISSHCVRPAPGTFAQGVLLAAVDGEVVVAALAGVHKLDIDVVANTFEIPVVPDLKRKRRCFAAAFVHGPLIGAARRMGVDGVRRAKGNVDVAAIGLPARFAGRIVVVGILDAPIVLFAEFVVGRVGIGIAAQPELLDERLALFVVAQVLECLPLFVRDDVGHVLIEPGLVGAFQLLPDFLLRLELLLVGALRASKDLAS